MLEEYRTQNGTTNALTLIFNLINFSSLMSITFANKAANCSTLRHIDSLHEYYNLNNVIHSVNPNEIKNYTIRKSSIKSRCFGK